MSKIQLVCKFCGNKFQPKRRSYRYGQKICRPKFCSLKCFGKSIRRQKHFKCDGCGKSAAKLPWLLKGNKHHFCTHKCYCANRQKFYKKSQRAFKCDGCGKRTSQETCAYQSRKHHFCRPECFHANRWKFYSKARPQYVCEYCNEKFSPLTDNHTRRFCSIQHAQAFRRKPAWLKDASLQLWGINGARRKAALISDECLNGWGEGRIKWKGQWRAYEDKRLGDSFRPQQIKAHDWHLTLKDPRAAIIVRWFALGRNSKPFVFENYLAFEKALTRIIETKKLPKH